jgi:hypothetical protein
MAPDAVEVCPAAEVVDVLPPVLGAVLAVPAVAVVGPVAPAPPLVAGVLPVVDAEGSRGEVIGSVADDVPEADVVAVWPPPAWVPADESSPVSLSPPALASMTEVPAPPPADGALGAKGSSEASAAVPFAEPDTGAVASAPPAVPAPSPGTPPRMERDCESASGLLAAAHDEFPPENIGDSDRAAGKTLDRVRMEPGDSHCSSISTFGRVRASRRPDVRLPDVRRHGFRVRRALQRSREVRSQRRTEKRIFQSIIHSWGTGWCGSDDGPVRGNLSPSARPGRAGTDRCDAPARNFWGLSVRWFGDWPALGRAVRYGRVATPAGSGGRCE